MTYWIFQLILPQSALGYGTLMLGKANEIDEAHWSEFHKIWLKGILIFHFLKLT